MDLKCVVCGHEPDDYERVVELESWLYSDKGMKQGVCVMVCSKHLSREMTDALRLSSNYFVTNLNK